MITENPGLESPKPGSLSNVVCQTVFVPSGKYPPHLWKSAGKKEIWSDICHMTENFLVRFSLRHFCQSPRVCEKFTDFQPITDGFASLEITDADLENQVKQVRILFP